MYLVGLIIFTTSVLNFCNHISCTKTVFFEKFPCEVFNFITYIKGFTRGKGRKLKYPKAKPRGNPGTEKLIVCISGGQPGCLIAKPEVIWD